MTIHKRQKDVQPFVITEQNFMKGNVTVGLELWNLAALVNQKPNGALRLNYKTKIYVHKRKFPA